MLITSSRHNTLAIAAVATLALVTAMLAGCAGDLDVRDDTGGGGNHNVRLDTGVSATYDTGAPPASDTAPPIADSTPTKTDISLPDKGVPKPDTSSGQSGVGGPCPCAAGALCVQGRCRKACKAGGACGVASVCGQNEACVPLLNNAGAACMPAVQPGAACSATAFCPVNHLCASYNNGPFRCLPTCTNTGGKCGNGGTCFPTGMTGCSFCTAP